MLLSCLKGIFARCIILHWHFLFLFFSSLHFFVHWLALLLLRCYCPLNTLKIFSLAWFFKQLFMVCLGVFFFVFTLPGLQSISQIFRLVFFNYYFLKCIFFFSASVSTLSAFHTPFAWLFSSVQSLSRVRLFATPWIPARQASRSSLRLTSIESVMPSSHLILWRPLLLLPPIPPSIRVFSKSTLCMRWPKYWSFSFSIIPSKEIPGLISFRMDWLDLLAV